MMNWILGQSLGTQIVAVHDFGVFSSKQPISFISGRFWMTSLQADYSAIYSASVLLRTTLRCFSERKKI